MAYTNRVTWEVLRTLDSSTMMSSSTYYALGTPLLHASYKLKIVNNSNVLITISIDGINDHDVAPASNTWLYNDTQAQISTASAPSVPANTQFYCKSATAGTGLIYLVSQYIITN